MVAPLPWSLNILVLMKYTELFPHPVLCTTSNFFFPFTKLSIASHWPCLNSADESFNDPRNNLSALSLFIVFLYYLFQVILAFENLQNHVGFLIEVNVLKSLILVKTS